MQAATVTEMPAIEARERLVEFVGEMAAGLGHVRRRENALVYVRGLIEHGGRKSLQPTLFRLGEDGARYESVQQFLADSPWDPTLLVRACAQRVAPELGVAAWVVDDTGIPKDGARSPGVKRQYSGTLGKIGNCQVTVSVHAVGERGSLPLGWALYVPEEWCADLPRRRAAKIPDELVFQTKPGLAAGLCAQAAGWEVPRAPVLADRAYGDNCDFRATLHDEGLRYVLSIGPQIGVFGPQTTFTVPERKPGRGRPPHVARPDREPESVIELAKRLPEDAWQTLACRSTPAGDVVDSRFALVRVVAAHPVTRDHRNDGLIWPHCDGLNWPHPSDGRLTLRCSLSADRGLAGSGIQSGTVRADPS